MLFETIRLSFMLVGFALCVSCVIAANRMTKDTCGCQKAALILILIGATMQLVLAFDAVMTAWGMLASIPISFGLTMKHLLDRRQPCDHGYFRRGRP